MLCIIIMVYNSPPPTGTTVTRTGATVLRGTAGVGGGMATAPLPISTVCTTTHPVPQMPLGFGGRLGMIVDIP